MKKRILFFVYSLLFLIPIPTYAKEYTCKKNNYTASITTSKDKLLVNENAFISIKSEYEYEVKYNISDKSLITINENGVIKALNIGKTNILVNIIFNKEIDNSCEVTIPIEIVSSDSSLKRLTLEELDIMPLFQSNKYEYEIILPYKYESINIIAEANDKNAIVDGIGKRYLNEGKNQFEITVTAQNNTRSKYKITILRGEANNDVSLKSLIVEGYILEPQFQKDIYKYELNVNKDVDEITINALPNYEFANIEGAGTKKLASGKNSFYIDVIAENGTNGRYEIVINKNNGTSQLKKLQVKDFPLKEKFKSNLYTYNVTVNSTIHSLDINAVPMDNDNVEIIGNEDFHEGENLVFIRLTSEDKSTTTYKIIVNKLPKIELVNEEKTTTLLEILFIMFVISIILMIIMISIFVKRNYPKKKIKKIKPKIKNK